MIKILSARAIPFGVHIETLDGPLEQHDPKLYILAEGIFIPNNLDDPRVENITVPAGRFGVAPVNVRGIKDRQLAATALKAFIIREMVFASDTYTAKEEGLQFALPLEVEANALLQAFRLED